MPVRLLKILALCCAVLLGVWVFLLYQHMSHGKSPFPAKTLNQARAILLQQGNSRIYLHKEKDHWTVTASSAGIVYPVDEERWHSLSSGLEDVQLEDVISERPESVSDFAVDAATGFRVTLRDAQGRVLADGLFGKQAPDARHIYFRYPDQPAVYLARGIFRGELGGVDLEGWRNPDLIPVKSPQISFIKPTDLMKKN